MVSGSSSPTQLGVGSPQAGRPPREVAAARRTGAREEVIDVIRAQGDPDTLPAAARDIVADTRPLIRTNRIDQTVFNALKNRYRA